MKKRTKFDVLREIKAIEDEIHDRNTEDASDAPPMMMSTSQMQKLAQLRHELKMFSVVPAKGKKTDRIKKHWQRQAEEAQKVVDKKKKEDAVRLKQAKKEVREEVKQDLASELSVEELKELIKQKENRS